MRRATWILWLMLALLPLRGWAVAGMGLPAAEHDAAVTVVMPCHQAGDEAGGSAGSHCQSCDWCHAAMGTAPDAVDPVKLPMADAPPATSQRDTGRPAVGGLERPPRNLLD